MEKMKLSEFISQTLTEIIDGVTQAQIHAEEKGARINPPHLIDEDNSIYSNTKPGLGKDQKALVTPIDFDILITISTDDKDQGGIGVFAASFGIGVRTEIKDVTENTNRIKFQVLAQLPQQR